MRPLGWMLFLVALDASARIVEDKRWVEVTAHNARGAAVSQKIMVTVFYDDALSPPFPAMVLNHGRAVTAADRAALGRAAYLEASKWFAAQGFMVAVPTRIGYGVSRGPDIEDTGPCDRKNYPPGYRASLEQTLAVLDYLRGWKEVSKDRAVIVGQSFGGTTAITVAAANTPGVQATINFAGGGGGRPATHPRDPCAPAGMRKLFAEYGKTARIPTLWIYNENDEYFGPRLPKEWFDAFRAAGGKGEFEHFPSYGGDTGHGFFTARPDAWKPRVLQFLRAHGYPDLKETK